MSEQNQSESGQPVNISLADLQILHRIVDLSSQRGAFRGGELSQVGAVYDKLTMFLQQIEAEQAKQAEAQQDADETSQEELAAEA